MVEYLTLFNWFVKAFTVKAKELNIPTRKE